MKFTNKISRVSVTAALLILAVATTAAHAARGGGGRAPQSSSRSSSSSFAENAQHSLYFGFGFLDHNAGVAASNAQGSKPFFGQTYGQLALAGNFKVYEEWSLSSQLIYCFPKTTPGGDQSTSVYSLGFRATRPMGSGFDLHIGPGVLYYEIKGTGGSATLNNGSGTSTFGLPSGTKTSTLLAWDIGSGYQFSDYRLELSFLITGILSSQKRAISPVLTFSQGFF